PADGTPCARRAGPRVCATRGAPATERADPGFTAAATTCRAHLSFLLAACKNHAPDPTAAVQVDAGATQVAIAARGRAQALARAAGSRLASLLQKTIAHRSPVQPSRTGAPCKHRGSGR